MKVLSCKDMGSECGWKGSAATEEELKKMSAEHGAAVHGMTELPEELWKKAQAVIGDE